MKAQDEWVRKSHKRRKKQEERGIVDLIKLVSHFFGKLHDWMEEMKDPRHQSYITYTQSDYVMMGILKNICSIESMRQMEESFNEENCIETLRLLSHDRNLKEMPHYDSLNNYLERLQPQSLSELRKKMVTQLIRGKEFYRGRLLGKYWRVILDGTGLFCFKERHCEHCLSMTCKDGEGKKVTRYYHKVLEAKIVLSDQIVVSLGTEFIENESEDVSKQDCENNAAKRLLKRIKKEYPRLPICIQGDALYAVEPIMELCRENGWRYIVTQKETRQPTVAENYALLDREEVTEVERIGKEKGKGRYYNQAGELSGKKEKMNLYEYSYEKKGKNGSKEVKFQWLTDIELSRKNLEEMIAAGRGRWKIENEGFNNQKHGQYRIEHLNSRNGRAMQNHYLLTQIADIIMQLYLAWNPLLKEIKQSKRNTSSRLLESFRRQPVTDEDVLYIQRYTTVYLE